jgi:hypothetical protein
MKRLSVCICVFVCFGVVAAALAQQTDYSKMQGQLMECSPPKFMLISDVDMDGKTITGMSTVTRNATDPVVAAFHQTFKLSEVKVTDARRVAVDDSDIAKMKGRLVVLNDGKEPLSAAYLALFREDAIVISLVAQQK